MTLEHMKREQQQPQDGEHATLATLQPRPALWQTMGSGRVGGLIPGAP